MEALYTVIKGKPENRNQNVDKGKLMQSGQCHRCNTHCSVGGYMARVFLTSSENLFLTLMKFHCVLYAMVLRLIAV